MEGARLFPEDSTSAVLGQKWTHFEELLEGKQGHFDVRFLTSDGHVDTNRIILSTFSPVFHSLLGFQHNSHWGMQEIILPDFNLITVANLLEIAHSGEVLCKDEEEISDLQDLLEAVGVYNGNFSLETVDVYEADDCMMSEVAGSDDSVDMEEEVTQVSPLKDTRQKVSPVKNVTIAIPPPTLKSYPAPGTSIPHSVAQVKTIQQPVQILQSVSPVMGNPPQVNTVAPVRSNPPVKSNTPVSSVQSGPPVQPVQSSLPVASIKSSPPVSSVKKLPAVKSDLPPVTSNLGLPPVKSRDSDSPVKKVTIKWQPLGSIPSRTVTVRLPSASSLKNNAFFKTIPNSESTQPVKSATVMVKSAAAPVKSATVMVKSAAPVKSATAPVKPTPIPEVKSTHVPEVRSIPVPAVKPIPIPKVKSTHVPEVRSTQVPAVKPTPVPAVKPTPVPAVKPTPVPAVKPTPVPAVKPTPVPAVKSTLVPEVKSIPVPAVNSTPVPEVKSIPVPEVEIVNAPEVVLPPRPISRPSILQRPKKSNTAGGMKVMLPKTSIAVEDEAPAADSSTFVDPDASTDTISDNEDVDMPKFEVTLGYAHNIGTPYGRYHCPLCAKSYVRKSDATRHIRLVHDKKHIQWTKAKSDVFKCDSCDSCFNSQQLVTVHSLIHTAVFPVPCPLCKVVCERPNVFVAHVNSHNKNIIRKPVMRSSKVSEKQETQKDERKPIMSCELCSREFEEKALLILHEEEHKTSLFPILYCPICKKNFCNRGVLLIHVRKHTSEPKLTCTGCKEIFLSKQSLEVHTKKSMCNNTI